MPYWWGQSCTLPGAVQPSLIFLASRHVGGVGLAAGDYVAQGGNTGDLRLRGAPANYRK
jgi:hypothetical protein